MKIIVDENIPRMTVRALHELGHDVKDMRGGPLQGISDDEVWRLAQRERRLLITTDKGFSAFRSAHHFGILIVRLRRPNRQKIHTRVLSAITATPQQDWPGLLLTMRDTAQSSWRAAKKE